jgi:hypothetical protein
VRLTTPPLKKILLRDLKRRPRTTQGCRTDDDDDDDMASKIPRQEVFGESTQELSGTST